jgi:DNA-binding NarL/FixJ family response regulator
MQPTSLLRVALADDYTDIRTRLRQMLLTNPHVEFVGEAASVPALITLCQTVVPDIVLLDQFMLGSSAPITVNTLLTNCPDLKILILSEADEDVFVRTMAQLPIAGYLLKGDVADCLEEALLAVSGGSRWYSPSLRPRLDQFTHL